MAVEESMVFEAAPVSAQYEVLPHRIARMKDAGGLLRSTKTTWGHAGTPTQHYRVAPDDSPEPGASYSRL